MIHLEKVTSEMGSASQANVRLKSLKKILATTLSPRVLLPAISETYKQIEKNWKVRLYGGLDLGEGRYGVETSKFHLTKSRVLRAGTSLLLPAESHGPVHEHLAGAHRGHEETGALLPSASAHHVLLGGPRLPSTAPRGQLLPTPRIRN